MKLSGETVAIILTEEGKHVLSMASVGVPESDILSVSVEESEDMGLWIRIPREDGIHFVLIRWEYILGVDMRRGVGRVIGMRGSSAE